MFIFANSVLWDIGMTGNDDNYGSTKSIKIFLTEK